jgi:hypothetical protein
MPIASAKLRWVAPMPCAFSRIACTSTRSTSSGCSIPIAKSIIGESASWRGIVSSGVRAQASESTTFYGSSLTLPKLSITSDTSLPALTAL